MCRKMTWLLSTAWLLCAAPLCAQDATLRSAAEDDYPPLCFVGQDGRATGFSIELLQAAARAMGRGVSFRIGHWPEVKEMLEQGKVDALPLVGRTPERELTFDFTFPYLSLHGAIVVREGTTGIHNLADLAGRSVAVLKGDNAEEFLRRAGPACDIRTTLSFLEALRGLSQGQHDAVVIQRLLALRLIQQAGLTNLRVVDKPLEGFRQDFCFAVKEGNHRMLALLNEGLALAIEEQTVRRLHAKWFAALELPAQAHIIIGAVQNFPPYCFLDASGRLAGYNVDLTHAIARVTGLNLDIRLGHWSEIRQGLSGGTIDAVQGMSHSASRDLTLDFTQPHAVIPHVAVIRAGNGTPPDLIDNLADMRLVVMQGNIMHDLLLEKNLQAHITTVATQEDALAELARGLHDCALVARVPAMYWIKQHGWDNLIVGQKPLLISEYCYAVPEKHDILLAKLSEGLKIIKETGEHRRIHEKWLGAYEQAQPSIIAILRYVAMIAGPLLLMLLAVIAWLWLLRREVARRTLELARSHKLLFENEERLRLAAKATNDVIWDWDILNDAQRWNDSGAVVFGWNDIVSHPQTAAWWVERVHPEDRQRVEHGFLAVVDNPARDYWHDQYRFLRADGSYAQVLDRGHILRDEHGKAVRMIGAMLDITERKEAEQERERLLSAIDQTAESIIITDKAGIIQYVNAATCTIGGVSRKKLIGKNLFSPTVEASQSQQSLDSIWQTVSSGRIWEGRVQNYTQHGSVIQIYTVVSPIRNALGDIVSYVSIGRDITRERHLEEQLLQSQKMEAIGTLAGGIAHDFNNILAGIYNYNQLALDKTDQGSPLHEDLQETQKLIGRAIDLVKQILAFSRKAILDVKPVMLPALVKEVSKMLRASLPSTIDIVLTIDESAGEVMSDHTQIHQMIMNLCTNAAHAMQEKGGVLSIGLSAVEINPDNTAIFPDVRPGPYAQLTIGDTGTGIDPAIINRIFEPFFTTKDVGKGTGMGLAVTHGIAKSLGGTIAVSSEPGKGSTFTVLLPRVLVADKHKAIKHETTITKGSESILFVDDEAVLAVTGNKILQSLGYTVTSLQSSNEALQLFQRSPEAFDLVITDQTMPHMTGYELAKKIMEIRKDIPIILCTGYSEAVSEEEARSIGIRELILKPIMKKEIAQAIRKALDGT